MANTTYTYEKIVELVDQLSPQEQNDLLTHLLELARQRELTAQEKIKLLRAAQINAEVNQEPSPHRADWYGDDGR